VIYLGSIKEKGGLNVKGRKINPDEFLNLGN